MPVAHHAVRRRERPQRDAGLLVIDAIRQRQPHAFVANEILRVGAERLMARDGEVARQVAEAAGVSIESAIFRMGDADHPIARSRKRRHCAADGDHFAGRFAAQLLRQRERRARPGI